MKSSGSEWDLDEFLRPLMAADGPGDYFSGGFSGADLLFSGDRGSINNSHSTGELVGGTQMLSQSLTTPKHSAVVSPTVETQSSICAGSPTSSSKPKGHDNQVRGGTSGSEQSDDDESQEIEGGSCEQSSITDLKRMRRMVSNRESARRSRKRKQAHLAELESQVDKLRGENASLYKQLADANQHFSEAVTDNRVLKSDVEALRVKVKMALDLVARGSLTCSLDNLLQSHIGSVQMLNSQLPCRASEVLPTIEVPTDDVFNGGVQVQNIEMDSRENIKSDNNMNSTRLNQNSAMQSIPGLDVTSCGATDVWSWDSHSISVSK